VSTKNIRTAAADLHPSCDVCGRTLLRGERSHPYLEGTEHRSVCELCTQRAAQEGWIREGTVPVYEGRGSRSEGRGSLLGRLRRRRDPEEPEPAVYDEPGLGNGRAAALPLPRFEARRSEPRHVRAVPTGIDQKISAAIDAFNGSEHIRTVAGVARSLGLPSISVQPAAGSSTVVNVVVAWELSWYRYEVDLAEETEPVRIGAQGAELDELSPAELEPNAVCAPEGYLALA
jgi:hypothetical protein